MKLSGIADKANLFQKRTEIISADSSATFEAIFEGIAEAIPTIFNQFGSIADGYSSDNASAISSIKSLIEQSGSSQPITFASSLGTAPWVPP